MNQLFRSSTHGQRIRGCTEEQGDVICPSASSGQSFRQAKILEAGGVGILSLIDKAQLIDFNKRQK